MPFPNAVFIKINDFSIKQNSSKKSLHYSPLHFVFRSFSRLRYSLAVWEAMKQVQCLKYLAEKENELKSSEFVLHCILTFF